MFLLCHFESLFKSELLNSDRGGIRSIKTGSISVPPAKSEKNYPKRAYSIHVNLSFKIDVKLKSISCCRWPNNWLGFSLLQTLYGSLMKLSNFKLSTSIWRSWLSGVVTFVTGKLSSEYSRALWAFQYLFFAERLDQLFWLNSQDRINSYFYNPSQCSNFSLCKTINTKLDHCSTINNSPAFSMCRCISNKCFGHIFLKNGAAWKSSFNLRRWCM